MCKQWVVIEIGSVEAYTLIRKRRPNAEFIRRYWPNAVALEVRDAAGQCIGFTFI